MIISRTGEWKEEVQRVREALEVFGRDSNEHKQAKGKLPAVTLSVQCSTRAKMDDAEKFESYTYILQDDVDLHKTGSELEDLKNRFSKDKYRVFTAISPSGDGLKSGVAVKLPESVIVTGENVRSIHRKVFDYFCQFRKESYPDITEYDQSLKDPFRLMYVTYDSSLIVNDSVEPLEVPLCAFETKNDRVTVRTENVQDDALRTRLDHFVEIACQKIQECKEGERHNTLIKQARLLGGYVSGSNLDEKTAKDLLFNAWRANKTISDDCYDDGLRAIEDGIEYGKKDPINITEEFLEREIAFYCLGNAEEDAILYNHLKKETIRFSSNEGLFYYFEQGLWKRTKPRSKKLGDIFDVLRPKYLSFIKYFKDELQEKDLKPERVEFLQKCKNGAEKKLAKFGTKDYFLSILLFLETRTEIDPSMFDRKPHLFHFNDGVFDFSEDRFREHRMDDYLTKGCGHNYPRDTAECPKFKAFTRMCFSENGLSDEDNDEIIKNDLTFICAQAMLGSFTNQCLLFTGEGNNGKSMWIEMIGKALGDYYYSANSDKSLSKGREQNTILADCQGVRLLNVGDLDDGFVIDNNFKTFVSDGEQDKVRKLYGDYFGYDKQFIVVGFNNHKLKINSDNASITDRFVFVPWLHQFPQAGRQLKEKFKKDYLLELEGILGLMLDYAREWYKKVYNEDAHFWSKGIKNFNETEYDRQTVKNSVRLFFEDEDCQYEVRADGKVTREMVYNEYVRWCSNNGVENKVTKNNFKKYLPAGIKSGTAWNPEKGEHDGFYLGLAMKMAKGSRVSDAMKRVRPDFSQFQEDADDEDFELFRDLID